MRTSILVVLLSISSVLFACTSKSGDDNSGSTNPPTQTNPEQVGNGTEPTNPSDNPSTPTSDAGTSVQDSGNADTGPKAPTNQAECLAACEASHPEGKVKADAITACWTAKCDPSCTHMPDRGPTNVRPATETKVCGVDYLPILTPSPSCSQCTHDECCTEWAECFSGLQADCVKLNECAQSCWTKFAP
jgi:hypothetical protein